MTSLYPDESVGHLNVEMAYLFLYSQFEKAAQYFSRAARVADPESRPPIYTNLGYYQLALGRYKKALASFQDALPAVRWSAMADYHLILGNHQEARALLEGKLADPSRPTQLAAMARLIELFADQGDLARATATAKRVQRLADELEVDQIRLANNLVAIGLGQTDNGRCRLW